MTQHPEIRSVTAAIAAPDDDAEALAAFLAAYPVYATTSRVDELRASEYAYLDEHSQVYLDYTGAGLPADAQLRAHAERLRGRCFGNPHSENPPSVASTELVERARAAVLRHVNASPDEYAAVFTANASAACRLVGEAYPFDGATRFVLTLDNHNSVNGVREFARARGAAIDYVPLLPDTLRVDEAALTATLDRGARGLLAFPAQSNFSGVRHPLHWIEAAHDRGYDVLLDAAAFLPTNRLDLSVVKPDFVAVSWYKVFGYPTGVGCLIARREALARLRRPWFAGGTIRAVSVQGDWYTMTDDESAFEDGTLNFLSIPDVEVGLSWIADIGVDVIHARVGCLTGWLLDALAGLRHGNGEPMVRVYGPHDIDGRGSTVAFNLLDPAGRVLDEREVARASAAAGISVRTGCFCNPGAGEGAFGIPPAALTASAARATRTLDEYFELLGLPNGGAIRASFGVASTFRDAATLPRFIAATYRDRTPHPTGLPPRLRC